MQVYEFPPFFKLVQNNNTSLIKNFAFTLSEVLITLGIIGVVAAMTIPNLMAKIDERRTVVKLQETQSILSQAIRLSEEEYGEASAWTRERWNSKGASEIAEKLKPSLKIALDCGLVDSKKLCIQKNYKRRNGQSHDINYATDNRYYKVVLMNGVSVWWKSTDETEKLINGAYIGFFVDTNGTALPNQWGRDLFMFAYDDNSIRPYGAPGTGYSYKTHCLPKNSTGYGCAWYVLNTKSMKY